ncbi:MAG: hypothetical protein NXI24_03825 [bacterium]|nr:hypothetical protein [bacterium]
MKYYRSSLIPKLLLSFLSLSLPACNVDRSFERDETVDDNQPLYLCLKSAYFVQKICEDELELIGWAADYEKYPTLASLTPAALEKITVETGDVDKATAVFYHRAILDDRNRRLIEYLDRRQYELIEKTPDFSNRNLLLALAPGMFWKDNPDVGAGGEQLRKIAAEMGLKEAIIPVEQSGTAETNGRLICEYIQKTQQFNGILLASVSKGGADVKFALKLCGQSPEFKKVIAWYNIGGINNGSPLIDDINSTFMFRLEARSYFFLYGYDWDGFMSMRYGEDSPLNFQPAIPEHMEVINIVPAPLRRHVSNRARPFYDYLAQFGPNDGLTLLGDNYIPGSLVYPAWRNDHYFRVPIPKQRMQAFLTYMIDR